MKRNAPAVIVDDLPFDAPAGHVKYIRNDHGDIVSMNFGCPCGCGATYGASFAPPAGWKLSGAPEVPTVDPSLGCYPTNSNTEKSDGQFHWHGYLRNGVFQEC